jgi:hypothetical protein
LGVEFIRYDTVFGSQWKEVPRCAYFIGRSAIDILGWAGFNANRQGDDVGTISGFAD